MEYSYFKHEERVEFNFWPSFADLMLTLVLVLVAVIYIYIAYMSLQTVNLRSILESQKQIVEEIGITTGFLPKVNGKISRVGDSITITNDLQLQKITFSDKILFPPDEHELNATGREMLEKVGKVIAVRMGTQIKEIQIHGHADTSKTIRHGSNMNLAAYRAIAVFDFLKDKVGIRPEVHLMSATTFGDFKPSVRPEEGEYSKNKRDEANSSADKRSANRRIELLLFYKK